MKTSNTDFVALLLPRQIEPRSVAQCLSRKRREPMQKIVVEQHHVDQQHFSIDGRQRQQRLVFRQSVHGKTLLFFPSGVFPQVVFFSKWCFFLPVVSPIGCFPFDTVSSFSIGCFPSGCFSHRLFFFRYCFPSLLFDLTTLALFFNTRLPTYSPGRGIWRWIFNCF